MLASLEIMLAVFAVVALGYGLARLGLFSEAATKGLSDFVWYAAIPALMLRSMAGNPIPGGAELTLVGVYYGAVAALYVVLLIAARMIFALDLRAAAALGLSSTFANGMMLGVPVITGLFGDEGTRILMILIAFHAPLLVTVTTLLAEWDGGGLRHTLTKTIARLIRQPVLLALAVGLSASALNWPLPDVLRDVTDILALAVAPCGLFAVGATMSRVKLKGKLLQAGVVVAAKLILLPIIVWGAMVWAGIQPLWAAIATTMAALPTGVIAYNFAAANNIAPERSATAFVMTNLLGVVTLTLWGGWLVAGL